MTLDTFPTKPNPNPTLTLNPTLSVLTLSTAFISLSNPCYPLKVWGEADLISSFDAINVFRPFAKHPELKTKGGWLHLDQNAYPSGQGKSSKHCVQGLVSDTYLTPI